jgi:hypothetical protein
VASQLTAVAGGLTAVTGELTAVAGGLTAVAGELALGLRGARSCGGGLTRWLLLCLRHGDRVPAEASDFSSVGR